MENESLEGSWVATSLDSQSGQKYIFGANNEFELLYKENGGDWKSLNKGSYYQSNHEIVFVTNDGINGQIIFVFGRNGNEFALGMRKVFAREDNLNGFWTILEQSEGDRSGEVSFSIITIDEGMYQYYTTLQTLNGNRNLGEGNGCFRVNSTGKCVEIYGDNTGLQMPFFEQSGTWDYHIVDGILVILNDLTWKMYYVKETIK